MQVHNRIISAANAASTTQKLKPGQIIQGDVVKLYPHQKAQIQLGSQKITAQLEAPLSVGGKYHFHVQSSKDVVHLRVIGELPGQQPGNTVTLLRQLELESSKAHVRLAQTLIDEKIPFTKEQLKRAFQLLTIYKNAEPAPEIVKGMLSAGLPIKQSIYKALALISTSEWSGELQSLLQQLQKNPDPTTSEEQLMTRLAQLLGKGERVSAPNVQFLSDIKRMLEIIGLNYENQLSRNQFHDQKMTLKSMLLQMLSQSDGTLHKQTQELLHFLNGMQMQSVNETTHAIQATMPLPGPLFQLPEDMQLEFLGGKTANGTIDPDSCRILFYITLTNLKETIIDMHVQKRTVALTIYNDQKKHMTEKASVLKPMLKKGLEAVDYRLATITFKLITEPGSAEDDVSRTTQRRQHKGVDYHI